MSTGADGAVRPVVFRQTSAVLVPVAVWFFCFLATADAVIEGTAGYAFRVAVLMSAISYAVWLVLASPSLLVGTDGVRVVNPFRTHWIPYAALDTVRVRGLVTLDVRRAPGRIGAVTSWNAPGLTRGQTTTASPVVDTVERLRGAWDRAHPGGDGAAIVGISWRWRPILGLVVLLTGNIAIWLR
jgi:hypothetical protein